MIRGSGTRVGERLATRSEIRRNQILVLYTSTRCLARARCLVLLATLVLSVVSFAALVGNVATAGTLVVRMIQ